MPMNAVYRGPADLPAMHPGVSAAGRAAAAARPDAAQHLRAALSRDGRRRAARRPSPDRHDPAGRRRIPAREDKPNLLQGRLRRPHHPARRDRRRPLSDRSSPASRASASRKSWRSRPPIANAASPTRRSPTTSSRARARTRSTARRCCAALADFLKANNLKADWEGIENAPNEALVNALAMMSPYGAAEKQALLEAPDLKTRAEILVARHRDRARQEASTDGETPLQ